MIYFAHFQIVIHIFNEVLYYNTFHKYSSSIGLATWAQLINILAPILIDEKGSIAQTSYYQMQYYRQLARPIYIPCSASLPLLANGIQALNISATSSEDGKGDSPFRR
jgi:alpha-N-arabinofuranosidase